MDAPTKSRPSVKFSRFHSSQQCDERKAVCTAIIANFSALWQMNLRMSHFQPRASFRENCHASPSADSVPTRNLPCRQRFSVQNLTTGKNPNSSQLPRKNDLHHWVAAEVVTAAFAAEVTSPYGIELLGEWPDERGVVGQDAVLEIALLLRLRAHPRAGEIRRAEVRLHAVNDDAFEMDARTEHPLGLLRPLRGSFASLIRPT